MKKANSYKLSEENLLQDAEVFLDPNTLDEEGTSAVNPDEMYYTDDGNFLVYQVKKKGSDWATAKIMDTKTKKEFPEK